MRTEILPTTLEFVAVPTQIVQAARETKRDAFGHRLSVVKTEAPCRHCLRIPECAGDMLLMSYQVLPDSGPYAEIGPIFVHATECERYSDVMTFPKDFLGRALILRAYDVNGEIADAVVAAPGEGPLRASLLLHDPSAAEVHVRHVSYTCFDFKIVRAA